MATEKQYADLCIKLTKKFISKFEKEDFDTVDKWDDNDVFIRFLEDLENFISDNWH